MGTWFEVPAFRHAAAALVGTMVGAGMFGIPFTFAKAGFWVGTVWLVVLGAATILFNLMFAELMLRTQGEHQLVGYAGRWMGVWGKRIVAFSTVVGIYGALVAYTILVGQFLHNILSNFITVDPQVYSVLFTAVLAPLILLRVKTVSVIEQALTVLFIVVIGIIAAVGIGGVEIANLTLTEGHYWFLPYGVLLFAFAGMTTMPIIRTLMRGRERGIRPVVFWAVVLVGLLYLLFATVVVGVSGGLTSPDALSGLFDFLGMPIIVLGSVLGVLTISTSYLMLGTALYEVMYLDLRLRRPAAWPLVVLPPLAFYFSGLRNFIDVIGTVGAVTVGLTSVVLIASYLKARRRSERIPEFSLHAPVFLWYVLIVVFAAGVGYALVWR